VNGGRTGLDPFFYLLGAFFVATCAVCFGLAWWMP
jgi:hypothetical protein